jgi:SAM-dependent methyltransferase
VRVTERTVQPEPKVTRRAGRGAPVTDYERLAARYDEDRGRWPLERDDVLDDLLVSRPVVRVLDLGCGTGRWLAAQRHLLGDSRVEFLGADPSAAMLGKARAKEAASLVRARAENLPVRDAAIDYVVSSYAFHHFGDNDRALDEIVRVLAPLGVFRINNIEPMAARGWWLYEFFPETVAIDAARFWPPTRIAGTLEGRGFTVDIDLDVGPERVPASQALADAERRVVSQLALLDDTAYDRGVARLRELAARREATVSTIRSRLCLTARREP